MTRHPDPPIVTDVFDYLMGEGFVMVGHPAGSQQTLRANTEVFSGSKLAGFREVWPGIEDDVRDLERMLR